MSSEVNKVDWTELEKVFNQMRHLVHAFEAPSLGMTPHIDQIIVDSCESIKHQLTVLQRALEVKDDRV